MYKVQGVSKPKKNTGQSKVRRSGVASWLRAEAGGEHGVSKYNTSNLNIFTNNVAKGGFLCLRRTIGSSQVNQNKGVNSIS